jgi:hypothetical protein
MRPWVRARVPHHEVGRRVEALDEDADLFVDVERQRTAHPLHAPSPEPARGGVDEGPADGLVVDRVEEAEEAGLVVPHAQVLAIDLRRAAADEPAISPGGEERHVGALEERVLPRVEPLAELEVEGRDPRRVVPEDDVRGANERPHVLARGVLGDGDGHLYDLAGARRRSPTNAGPLPVAKSARLGIRCASSEVRCAPSASGRVLHGHTLRATAEHGSAGASRGPGRLRPGAPRATLSSASL